METKRNNKGFPQICKVGGADRPAAAACHSTIYDPTSIPHSLVFSLTLEFS